MHDLEGPPNHVTRQQLSLPEPATLQATRRRKSAERPRRGIVKRAMTANINPFGLCKKNACCLARTGCSLDYANWETTTKRRRERSRTKNAALSVNPDASDDRPSRENHLAADGCMYIHTTSAAYRLRFEYIQCLSTSTYTCVV